MDFIALIIAIIAISLALKARARITRLEHNLGLVARRLEGAAAPEAPPATETAKPASPLDVWATPAQPRPEAPAQPRPAARLDESDMGKIIAEASQPPAPPAAPPAPRKSFEEQFGASWVVCPWITHDKEFTRDDALKAAEVFDQVSSAADAAGLRFAYHCHGYEMLPSAEGTRFDTLAQNTDAKRVLFQIDVFHALLVQAMGGLPSVSRSGEAGSRPETLT